MRRIMEMSTFKKSTRRFQVWEYQVSHGQLLLRSPSPTVGGDDLPPTNLDLIFVGVVYMNVPSSLQGIAIEPATDAEHAHIDELLGRSVTREWVRILVSGGRRFIVVAAGWSASENDWDIFESPFEFRSNFHGVRETLLPRPS
jgi:hypothetical protein